MDVTLPNGVVIRGVPEGTSKSAIAFKAITSGLAKPEDFGGTSSSGPAEGMSGFEKFRAGWGKGAYDLARGAGQLFGAVSNEDVQQSRNRDAALMATGAGKAGYIGGSVADALPAAFIPGANTVAGAAAIGAGLGALQPSVSTGETLTNTAMGGALGGVGLLAGRGIAAGYGGAKALVEPFMKGGQERIAARTLQAFAGGKNAAGNAAQNIEQGLQAPILKGVQPTAAELAQNPGIAQLERSIRNNPEYVTAMTDRSMANKDAMMGALNSIAGTPAQKEAAGVLRGAATKPLYDAADHVVVEPDAAFNRLMKRPSMQGAWTRATQLAQENGHAITEPGKPMTGRTLHYLKMAMDDLTDNPQASGIGGNEVRAIRDTKGSLLSWMDEKLPIYGMGRRLYTDLSKPINQMEVGQAFRNKLQPALADFGASSRTRAAAYAEALRSGDDFAAQTLGRSSAKLGDVMQPQQMTKLNLIAEQLGRRSNADELGRAVGSNTGQNMVSQNVLRQLLGPLGLPESTIQRAAESTLLQSVMRPAQFAGQLGEQRVMQTLARASLDPKVAKEMLRVGIDPKSISLLLRNQQFIAPALASGTQAARQ